MAKLAARAEKRNGRVTCAPSMGGSFTSQGQDGARHQNHPQTENQKGRANKKYKCRFMAQGFRQIKDIHYDDLQIPTPSQASTWMVLVISAVKDCELRQLDLDRATWRRARKKNCTESYPSTTATLQPGGPTAKGDVRPCAPRIVMVENVQRWTRLKGVRAMSGRPTRVFRQVLRGKVVVILVVYVDDLLVASETKRDEEQAVEDLRSCFPIKDLREAGFYLGYYITQELEAGTLKLDQHRYVRTVASKFNIEKMITTPAAVGAKPLSKDDASQRGGDGKNACHPISGGGRGPHMGCNHDPP